MFLTNIDIENINDEIIKQVLFSTSTVEYSEADCLIVFGCHIKALLDERIKLAINILNTKKIGKIIVTGGIGVHGDFNESEYMKEVLLNNGTSEDMILVEDKSTTTEENITNSIEILKQDDLIENKRIVLVSNQAHLRRIGMEFKKQLKDVNFEIIYEYPQTSLISLENVLKNNELKLMATNEVKKIIKFIKKGIIDDELIKFNPKTNIFQKSIIFSHESDIDGLGCAILGKLAFENVDCIFAPNIEKLESIFREFIESHKLDKYDDIYVTDLALYDPSLTMVAESSLKDKVHVFDHHKRAIDDGMNRYSFTKIVEDDGNGKKCGTGLFYEYLIQNNLIINTMSISEFVELTRLEDTWEWKNSGIVGEQAHDLAILFNAIGLNNYVSSMTSKLLNNPISFELSEEEKTLIQNKKDEYNKLLQSIILSAEYFLDENNNKFGIVFADYEYRNELAEYIRQHGNPEAIKYFIVVAMNKGEFGQKSYRSIDESFDVNEVAVMHGGGGHPGAASVNITEEQKAKALVLTKKEGLKYLADSKYSI